MSVTRRDVFFPEEEEDEEEEEEEEFQQDRDFPLPPSRMTLGSPKSAQSIPSSPKSFESVQPPKFLKQFLELSKEFKQIGGNQFDEFLQAGQHAIDSVKLLKLPIEASYKLISGLPEKVAGIDEDKNDTLCLIFDFYARIRQTKSSKTFADTALSFQTMNFSKIEVFCRDFEVIPKLLTREDVKILWEDIGREHVAKGLGIFTVIDFTEFKDLIVRMALWSYYKPGLKKLILTVEGFLPKAIEIVRMFCTYLKLYDDDYIHNFLRTVGRKTQGDYNYRSKDEMNLRTKLEVRVDTNARSLKQITRKTPKVGGSRPATGANSASLTSSQKIDQFGDKVKNQVVIRPANPREVISSTNPVFNTIKKLHSSPLKPKISFSGPMIDRFEDLKNNPLSINLNNLNSDQNNEADREFAAALESYRSEVTNQMSRSGDNSRGGSRRSKKGGSSYSFQPEVTFADRDDESGDEEDDDNGKGSHIDNSTVLSSYAENSFEALREMFEHNYDPRLNVELLKYTYVPPRAIVVDWIPTHGPLVDLGLLEGGMKVTINYRLVNDTADDILVDATTKNFGADDTDVKMFSKPLIPGLSRMITVTFTVPSKTTTNLGSLEVLTVNMRNRVHSIIKCPIFYYVDPGLERPLYPSVNARSLQDQLIQRFYLTNTPSDVHRRRIPTNFQTKRGMDGTWTLTNKFSIGSSKPPTASTGRSQLGSRGDFVSIKPSST